jgi:hypothetical protein
MTSGAHVIFYSKDAEADRAFFRDVLGFKSVVAGHGWLILCDGLKIEMASLAKKGVKCSAVQEERWGSLTKMRLPGGGRAL